MSSFNFVNNLVYARDPTILEDRLTCLNIRNLMQHENLLDVNAIIKERNKNKGEGEGNAANNTKKKN